MQKLKMLGSEVDLVNLDQIRQTMDDWVQNRSGQCRQMVVTGFHGLWEAHQKPGFRSILNGADLWVPDGIAPVWVARLKGKRNVTRTPGMEILKTFLALANERGYRSFFYGDTEDTLQRLKVNLERDYPGHKIVGTYSPPFRPLTPEEDEAVVKMINEARPDVVWVGLGLPKQDLWVHAHKERLNAAFAVGVGAVFGFMAGKVRRCPDWLGNHGLEWAYRFIMEPRKLWRRDLLDGPRFLWHVGLELAGLRRYD